MTLGPPPPLTTFPIGCLKAKISARYGEEVASDAVDAFRYDELGGMANFIATKINPAVASLVVYAELVQWSADCLKEAGLLPDTVADGLGER